MKLFVEAAGWHRLPRALSVVLRPTKLVSSLAAVWDCT
jgi:hypothetical protein